MVCHKHFSIILEKCRKQKKRNLFDLDPWTIFVNRKIENWIEYYTKKKYTHYDKLQVILIDYLSSSQSKTNVEKEEEALHLCYNIFKYNVVTFSFSSLDNSFLFPTEWEIFSFNFR